MPFYRQESYQSRCGLFCWPATIGPVWRLGEKHAHMQSTQRSPQEQQSENEFLFHPNNVMLSILLFGLSGLFLALTVAYVYTRVTMNVAPVSIPPLFFINTFILLGSSYTMQLAKKRYLRDDTGGYQGWTTLQPPWLTST